jgi:hypothetical protein
MHIYKNPLLLGAFLAALEGGFDVSVLAVAITEKSRFRRRLSWCIGQENNSTRKG